MTSKRKAAPKVEIGGWRLTSRLLRAVIQGRGPAANCDGSCCRHGVYVSVTERSRILAHAAEVRRHMDATQPRRTSEWFSKLRTPDEDLPEGYSFGTRVHRRKCVFRTSTGLCSLQAAEPAIDLPRGQRLKPRPCYLFPLTTVGRIIDFDPLIEGKRPCCSRARRGDTRAVRAWAWELRLALGRSGYRKLLSRLRLTPRGRR